MRIFLTVLALIAFQNLFSQEIIKLKDLYIENNLAFKTSNKELFTGIAQSKRNNGHIVYEEEYKNGVIVLSNLYFNGKGKIISDQTIYNSNKPFVLAKKISYNLKKEIIETILYDNNGLKILVENFKNGVRTYSCQYLGKRKNGYEISYEKNGIEVYCQTEYKNGKKIK
ncbi:hypothetical protein [Robertkochia sediminum]|uniref:hypothetical protein n=1 Tax=Robertkochia sediminum TaxID=2785326 RepID=UPI0019324C46|nr:hypothetical protein [Robertkochia sediminum]MBL7471728.1 hypothetical protein [Robertkochia sediminum]